MSWGVGAAGFSLKPLTAILADLQAKLQSTIEPALDLSPTSPEGQLCGILANAHAALWELAQTVYNADNRQAVEGTGLDALGAMTGAPLRNGPTYTQVYVNLQFNGSAAPSFAPGALVANVAGQPSQTYSNVNTVSPPGGGGPVNAVLFQAQVIGQVPTVSPLTLTGIPNPTTGWLTVVNPAAESQTGTDAETDADYGPRQVADLVAQGSCNPSATAAALYEIASAVYSAAGEFGIFAVNVIENTSDIPIVVGSLTLPGHSMAVVVYDQLGLVTLPAIAQAIWQNKPSGTALVGGITATYVDPYLGSQLVRWTTPAPQPLYITATVVLRPGSNAGIVLPAIQAALVAAAVAPTPSSGVPPIGQLAPGAPVVAGQIEGVILSVPGVFDVPALAFDFVAAPTNTGVKLLDPTKIATISATNIVLTVGTYP